MKCPKCGSELQEGVKFCRDCGTEISLEKRFCKECGHELLPGSKFCANCGARVDLSNDKSVQHEVEKEKNNHFQTSKGMTLPKYDKNIFGNNSKEKYRRILIIAMCVAVLFVAWGIVRHHTTKQTKQSKTITKPTNYKIKKGSEYAFMSDEWNVFIATAVSDSIIKLEHWDKTFSSTKEMSYSEDIGVYKINDPETGFSWLDNDQTAFQLSFKDKNTHAVKKLAPHIFTVNINDNAKFRGTDYNKNIVCYTYVNDDWHMYRAIPLSEHLIKIECWSRSTSDDDFCFGWDWCVFDPDNNDMDFEWTDDEHTSFTITTKDPNNKYYWKKDSFVLFENKNKKANYKTVLEYLNR